MSMTNVPGARAVRCLVCENEEDGLVRRVWEYPEHWFELADDDLRRLCE
jgi:hypothetical protein